MPDKTPAIEKRRASMPDLLGFQAAPMAKAA